MKPTKNEYQKVRYKTAQIKQLVFLGFLVLMAVIGLLWFARPSKSEVEKRTLTKFPKLTLQGLWDGSFFFKEAESPEDQPSGVSTWYADTFPLREMLISGDHWIKSLYGKQGEQLISDGQTAEEIPTGPLTPEQLASLAGLDDTDPPTEPLSTQPRTDPAVIPTGQETGETQPVTEPAPSVQTEPPETKPVNGGGDATTPAEKAGSIYITENCGYGLYYFSQSGSAKYCINVNSVAQALNGKANVYCLICPISAGVMLSDSVREGIGCSDENEAINWMYAQMDPSVKTLQVFPALKSHNNEYIYFHTDHHWTALGAYYAYREFCAVKGITPHELKDFETMTFPNFLGTFYSSSNQSPALKANPDTVTAYIPNGTNDMTMYSSYGQAEGRYTEYGWRIIYDVSGYPSGGKYGTFAGGDQPYNYAHNETITDGSSVLVVKDSYGNAFIPFLVDHYEHIYWIDYRSFESWCAWAGKPYRSISGLVSEKGIQDVILCNNINSTGSQTLLATMAKIFK